MSVWSWIRGLLTNDMGFMVVNGRELKWPRSTVIRVLVAPEAIRYWAEIERAAGTINQAVGRVLIGETARVSVADIMKWEADGHGQGGTILVRADGAFDDHGHTEPVHDRAGNLHAVRVTLPERVHAGLEGPMVLHEFLHGVGLAHDKTPRSILWPTIQGHEQVLLSGDIKRLRKAYGAG